MKGYTKRNWGKTTRFVVQFRVNEKLEYFGSYDTEDEAKIVAHEMMIQMGINPSKPTRADIIRELIADLPAQESPE